MKEIILISSEIGGFENTFGGQGHAVFSLIRQLRRSYRVKLITLGFKGQKSPDSRYIEGVEVIRVFTPASSISRDWSQLMGLSIRKLRKFPYYFEEEVFNYLFLRKEKFRDKVIHIHMGFESGLLVEKLKKEGFKKVIITFHWLKTRKYLKGLFEEGYIDLRYNYRGMGAIHRFALKKILKRICPDEKRFLLWVHFFYRFGFGSIMPEKVRFYYESDVRSLGFSDKVTVPGKSMKDYLLRINPGKGLESKIEVIGNGVDKYYFENPDPDALEATRKRFGIKEDETVLLFMGRIDPMKGIEHLLGAVRFIEYTAPPEYLCGLRILIAGEACGIYKQYLDVLKRMAQSPGCIRTDFAGQVNGEQKCALYRLSAVCILPSVYEPFGLVVLESMAAGTPVIVSDACGVSEYVTRDSGAVVKYGNGTMKSENLGRAILKVLEEDAGTMRESARKEAAKYIWSDIALAYRRAYDMD